MRRLFAYLCLDGLVGRSRVIEHGSVVIYGTSGRCAYLGHHGLFLGHAEIRVVVGWS